MKKLILLLLMMLLPMLASAYDALIDGVFYNFNASTKTATVTSEGRIIWDAVDERMNSGNKTSSGDIIIPSEIKYNNVTYRISAIDEGAFRGATNLISVVIPDGVTSIGDKAFRDCTRLASVTIPNSVTSVGAGAFSGCSGLTSITLPNSVTSIEAEVLHGCSGLTSVTIPNNVTSIGTSAFAECSSLTSINIPNKLTSIGQGAFAFCSGLASITIPNSVTSIGYRAFNGCWSLTSVHIMDITAWCKIVFGDNPLIYAHHLYINDQEITELVIPDGVTDIGAAFQGCSSLTSVTIPNSVTDITQAFSGCSGLTSITIPEGMTSIGQRAFSDCSGLTSVTIPSGVTSIGHSAFSGCSGLTSITIPTSVTSIGRDAFSNCSGLTSVHIADITAWCKIVFEDNPLNYAHHLYLNNQEITELKIPDGMTSIGHSTFSGCSGLTSVTIPSGVTSIEASAFFGCSGLTSITIPASVTSIEQSAFSGCSNLTSIIVEEGNSKYDSRNHSNAIIEKESNALIVGCKNTIIPNSVTSIGVSAFENCSGLTSITIPKGVTSIGDWAFSCCSSLSSITIPKGMASIGNYAFQSCSGLTSITIPEGVTSIGVSAFENCSGLTSITIPKGVTSIGNSAFANCYNLNTVIIDKAEPFRLNDFYNREKISLYVPKGSVEAYANAKYWKDFKEVKEFYRKEAATYSIEMNKTLTVIDAAETTEEAVEIPNIEIPSSVIIDGEAYAVTAIAESAFNGNTIIKQVSIPESIEEIGDAAFSGCSELNTIYCLAEEPVALGSAVAAARTRADGDESTSNVFNGVDKVTCLLYVPAGSVDKYMSAIGWKDFKYIVVIGANFIIGNVNGDDTLDDKDLQALINYVMGKESEGTFDEDMADVNKDGHVDVNDVVFLVKLLGQK